MNINETDLEKAYKDPILFQNSTTTDINLNNDPIKQLICVQAKINRVILTNRSLKYVYKINDKIDLSGLKEIRKAFFQNTKYDISHIKTSDNIVLLNINKIKTKLTGYSTYGDYEDFLSIALAPIIDINQLQRILLQQKHDIENIQQRIGLTDFLIKEMNKEYNEFIKLGVSI